MIYKRFVDVSAEDIKQLVDAQAEESRVLDFKRELPDLSDSNAKREFCDDIVAFANTEGGWIVFGIAEAVGSDGRGTGRAGTFSSLGSGSLDSVILQMEQITAANVEPRLELRLKSLRVEEGQCLVIWIPKSLNGPHRCRLSKNFVGRSSSGKFQMDVPQIRAAILATEELPRAIREFRAERIMGIRSGSLHPLSVIGPTVVAHLMPVRTFRSTTIDAIEIRRHVDPVGPMTSYGYSSRYNIDGVIQGYIDSSNGRYGSYNQFFRNGVVEGVDCLVAHDYEDGLIPGISVEQALINYISRVLGYFNTMNIESPILIFVSILGVRGKTLAVGSDAFLKMRIGKTPIDRDELHFSEVLVEDRLVAADKIVQPILDELNQASGYERCFRYKDDKWSGS